MSDVATSAGSRSAVRASGVRQPIGPQLHGLVEVFLAVSVFLSAFLLFQVQLFLGKQILPMFGGSPAVWTTCLLVFQVLLLAGYAYAHLVAMRLQLSRQTLVHICMLTGSLALVLLLSRGWLAPLMPGADWRPAENADPVGTIIKFLLAAIGLPFFLLSTTSPLAQHWLAKSVPGSAAYRLYALSNAGSLLGLFTYPFLIEPNLRLRSQAWVWTVGYAMYVLACGISAYLVRRACPESTNSGKIKVGRHELEPKQEHMRPGLWMTLAAVASTLLLATTNFICQEVAVIPFLWVMPLCLYLLSFIICFESDRWYRREILHPLFAVAAGMVILVTLPNSGYSYIYQLVPSLLLLFAGCMVCHGEAALTRPSANGLTKFYLCISIGGAIGGVFVSLIAPRLFPNFWEYPLGILACAGLILHTAMEDEFSWWHTGRLSLAAAMFGAIALLIPRLVAPLWPAAARLPVWDSAGAGGILLVVAVFLYLRERRGQAMTKGPGFVRLASRICLALLTAGLAIPQKAEFFHVVERSRNFFGVLAIVDVQPEDYLALRHGTIVHGFQFQDPQRERLATGYYGQTSAANIVIRNWPRHPMRVGLVGMGTGTLATIGQPDDVYRFYELNPDVYRWSTGDQPHFKFLKDSPARIEVVTGDARISLEREASRGEFQRFDVLVLDAFSSDAIPMHLLTREAFRVYAKHLRGPEAVIAVHISNRTLDLGPVLAGLAQEYGLHSVRNVSLPSYSYLWPSDWILLSREALSLHIAELKAGRVPFPAGAKPVFWTDDYSNLMQLLR